MFLTVEEVRQLSPVLELDSLDSKRIENYIDRADGWIRRATNQVFTEETDELIQMDLRTATLLLVELLFLKDEPEFKEQMYSPIESERIGSYSYNLKAQPGDQTGNAELDSILESLTYKPVFGSMFRVSGPSDRGL